MINIADNNFKGKAILIIEDDPVSSEYFSEVLSGTGVQLYTTSSAEEGFAKLKENPGIDLVLLDMRLPGISGYEATKILKQQKPGLIIIAQTAYALYGDREKAIEAGCDDYLAKPVKMSDLICTLRKWLSE